MFAFILYPERDKSLLRRHPWVFSKAVASIVDLDKPSTDQETVELKLCKPAPKKDIAAGALCQIRDHQGKFLCYAHYSPHSQIMLRAISFKLGERIDYDFFKQRLAAASAKRIPLQQAGNDGVRLVAAEGDYLPGLIVDRYDKVISLAITSWGMEANYEHLIVALHELYPECYLYERSDGKARSKEHLPQRVGLIDFMQPSAQDNLQDEQGKALPNSRQVKSVPRLRAPQIAADAAVDGEQISLTEAIPDTIYVKESNLVSIPIDVMQGHKTGGYLDQRQSRLHTYHLCCEFKELHGSGPRVLNCFAYTGGFGLFALKGGASSVYNVDVSGHALGAAKAGVAFNHLDPGRCKFIKKDVFAFLREEVKKGTKFDVVILDPPKFAESKSTLATACRGYQDINRLGLQLVASGGHLLTFSCSGLMTEELFQKIVADAALDAQVEAQIVGTLRQDRDHPVALPCPESFYLKGLDILVN